MSLLLLHVLATCKRLFKPFVVYYICFDFDVFKTVAPSNESQTARINIVLVDDELEPSTLCCDVDVDRMLAIWRRLFLAAFGLNLVLVAVLRDRLL